MEDIISLKVFCNQILQNYGPQLCLLLILICITIWRKELSSNHVYHDRKQKRVRSSSRRHHVMPSKRGRDRSNSTSSSHNNMRADVYIHHQQHGISDILDSVGFCFSFEPVIAVVYTIYRTILALDDLHWNDGWHLISNLIRTSTDELHTYAALNDSRYFYEEDDFISSENVKQGDVGEKRLLNGTCQNKVNDDINYTPVNNISAIHALPSCVQIQLFSFLSPRDVCVFSCVSKHCTFLTDDHHSLSEEYCSRDNIASLIWSELLCRDFYDVLTSEISHVAFHRSLDRMGVKFDGKLISYIKLNQMPREISRKDFYFYFSESWLNWSIAGQNSEKTCLVGLHGSVLNMTSFLDTHPGTPETLMMQGGRDATKYFEDMGHSIGARKLAMECVVIDRNRLYHEIDFYCEDLLAPTTFPMQRSMPWKNSNLRRVRSLFEKEAHHQQLSATQWLKSSDISDAIGDEIHSYYDPISQLWQWWYTNWDMCPVFVDSKTKQA